MTSISNVRTWSYVANKKNWVENSDYWVQLTKSIEDKLSDKLHDELTKSFIDKKISILSRSLKQDLQLKTTIDAENKIIIDIHEIKNACVEEMEKKYAYTPIEKYEKLKEKNHLHGC